MSGQLVTAETGVLRVFNDAGVFAAADVHVARRVAALSGAAIGDDDWWPPRSPSGRCGPGRRVSG